MDNSVEKDVYPSRVYDKPILMERVDPVVYTSSNCGPLSEERLRNYNDKGYLFFENFFSDAEIEQYRRELSVLLEEGKRSERPEYIIEPESEEIRSIFAVHRDNAMFRQLSENEKLLDIVKQLLGSDVYVHQSRVNFKPGLHGKEFYWHSDFETWHVEDGMPRMRALSCSIALEDNYSFNGPVMLIPGSHQVFVSCVGSTPENNYKQSLKKQEIGVPDNDTLRHLVERYGIEMPTGKKGSLLLFDCNVMHGSNGNISPYPRSNVFLVYNSVENRLELPFSGQKPRPEYIGHR